MDVLPPKRKGVLKIETSAERQSVYTEMERILVNDDLRRHIFSFGDPEHRDRMKRVSCDLTVDVNLAQEKIISDRGERTAMEYFRDEYKAQELIAWSRYLNRCKCCTRHSHCKPYIEWIEGVQYVRIPEHSNQPRDCECPCRNLSRHMMKVYKIYLHHLEID